VNGYFFIDNVNKSLYTELVKKYIYPVVFMAGFVVGLPLAVRAQIRFSDLLVDKNAQVNQFRRLLENEVPTPTPEPKMNGQALGSMANKSKQVLTIAVLGDSMIDVLQPELPQLRSALESYFPETKFELFNFGVGASDLEYAVERLTNEYEYLGSKYPSVLSVEPDILVLESFAYNNFGYGQEGLDKQWLLISDIITQIEKISPDTKIVLSATIAPNSTIYGKGIDGINWNQAERLVRTEAVKDYLENIINYAGSQGYLLADAYTPSLDAYGEGKPVYINSKDNLHPSGPGGELYCRKVAETIAELEL
jgi:hypothetical protein